MGAELHFQSLQGFYFMTELNWAAVIPARYVIAKDISSTQKLLLGLISSLSNLKGYCFASNDYLAELLGISKIRVSQSISDLEKKGYLGRIIYRNDKKEIEQRILTLILDKNLDIPINENIDTLLSKTLIPISEKFKENNKVNNKLNNKINNIRPTLSEVENYFLEKGSTIEKARQAYEYYEVANWHDSKGKAVKNWKQKMLAVWINNNNFNNNFKKSKTEQYADWFNKLTANIGSEKNSEIGRLGNG
ncbi:MAG: helix-turn-helix domain-containing protein [Flavobacterium sp.]